MVRDAVAVPKKSFCFLLINVFLKLNCKKNLFLTKQGHCDKNINDHIIH